MTEIRETPIAEDRLERGPAHEWFLCPSCGPVLMHAVPIRVDGKPVAGVIHPYCGQIMRRTGSADEAGR